jgi:recombination protein RecA
MAGKKKEQEVNPSDKAIDIVIGGIEKKYGKGSIFTISSGSIPGVKWIPSGSLMLDRALGGGYPGGRIIDVFGEESVGKTTLCLHAIAEMHKSDPESMCAFVDAEHALDPTYASSLGVDMNRMLISQPDNGEQALEIVDMLVRSGAVKIIVIDSVPALVPQAELAGEVGEAIIGLQARLMSQALRKLTAITSRSGTTVFFTNQMRAKIAFGFGPNTTSTGGNALKFYASQRVEIRRIGQVKQDDVVVGFKTRIKAVKNKVASPYKVVEVTITFGKGINRQIELIDLGMEHGIIKKSGAWYSYGEISIGQGLINTEKFLEENPDISQEIREKIVGKQ